MRNYNIENTYTHPWMESVFDVNELSRFFNLQEKLKVIFLTNWGLKFIIFKSLYEENFIYKRDIKSSQHLYKQNKTKSKDM